MRAIVTLFISTACCVIIPHVSGGLDCNINPDHYLTKGRAVTGESFWESHTRDAVECARSCIRRKSCTAFNFTSTSGLCQLSTNGGQVVTTTRKDVAYSDIAHWPTQIDRHCFKRPCADDEICIPRGGDGSTCSHSCFKLARTCPLPAGSVPGQPRTVGSIFTHTCGSRFVGGGDSALCLASGEWNKTMDTSCQPLHGSSCEVAADCSPIQGTCDNNNNTCTCPDGHWYNEVTATCHPECQTGWIRFMDQCYYFGTDAMANEDAWDYCAEYSSQIVYIVSSEEINFLKHEMNRQNTEPVHECGGYLNTTTGGFSSFDADGDGLYEHKLDCHWLIMAQNHTAIELSFTGFELEGTSACIFDNVKIYDGMSIEAPLLGRFCGEDLPPTLTSTSNAMYVVFHTDFSVLKAGFNASYTTHYLAGSPLTSVASWNIGCWNSGYWRSGYWNSLYQYTDNGNERWRMTDGTRELTANDWYPGEPNLVQGRCTVMLPLTYQWCDVSCTTTTNRPLCKKPA